MNNDQAAGKWEQIKGRAKKAWAELTDDDFLRAEGSVDKLYGVIKEKVGDTEEAIKSKLDASAEAVEDHIEQADGRWEDLKGRAKRAWGELTDDDFQKAEGSVEKLHAVIQKKVGVSKDAIKARLDEHRTT